jgi:hypothetical protein
MGASWCNWITKAQCGDKRAADCGGFIMFSPDSSLRKGKWRKGKCDSIIECGQDKTCAAEKSFRSHLISLKVFLKLKEVLCYLATPSMLC